MIEETPLLLAIFAVLKSTLLFTHDSFAWGFSLRHMTSEAIKIKFSMLQNSNFGHLWIFFLVVNGMHINFDP